MIIGTLGAGYFGYHYGVVGRRPRRDRCFGAARRRAARARHRRVRRRPHRLRRRDQHHRAWAWPASSPRRGSPGSPAAARRSRRRCRRRRTIDIPFIADPMNTLEEQALVPDQRPRRRVVEMLTKNLLRADAASALVLIFGTIWVLWHTRFGLRLRSCGEAPAAAETLGVNVYRYKFIAVLISGALAGLGGAYLALVSSLRLPGRPDGRPRLHRPGRDDLRQLAARSGCSSGRLLFGYTAGAARSARAPSRCTRCCCSSPWSCASWRDLPAAPRLLAAAASASLVFARAVPGLVPR